MRLTLLNQFYLPDLSPTAKLAASLAEHRAARGDRVTVVASRGGYVATSADARRSDRRANPAVYRVWTPRLGKATKLRRIADYACFYLGALWCLAMLPRQDVIVSLTTPPFIVLAALLHKLIHRRTRVLLWNMDCYPEIAECSGVTPEGRLPSRIMRRLNRFIFRRLDHLVCLDGAMRRLLTDAYAPPGRALPASVIPNWEPAARFARPSPQPWPPANHLGLTGRFVVLYMGNAGYGHRFDTVIEAARKLQHRPVTFLFIGGGARRAELERAAAGCNNIVLHDYVPEEQIGAVLATGSVALITLRDATLGVMSPSKLHANLAVGLPVVYIGPPGSNVDEAIRTYGCGVSLRHGQADELVAFIEQLMTDSAARQSMACRARNAFDAAYCDTRTLPRFDAVLDALAPTTG